MSVIIDALKEWSDAQKKLEEERREKEQKRKEELRKAFETEEKTYNRGSVIAAMANSKLRRFDSFDMDRVLSCVTNSEKAEAAVGLIESGMYDSFDIARVLKKL